MQCLHLCLFIGDWTDHLNEQFVRAYAGAEGVGGGVDFLCLEQGAYHPVLLFGRK